MASSASDNSNRAPRAEGGFLALEQVLPGVLERDGSSRSAIGRVPDQHAARSRSRLEARSSVDQVSGHHALPGRANRHRRLAGEDSRARLQGLAAVTGARVEARDHRDHLEGGPHCALSIVLVGSRRTPQRHHGVTDELLNRPAVAVDDIARSVEVATQQLSRVLRVALLRRARESHQVDEEDRDETPLRDRRDPGCGGRAHDRCCRDGADGGDFASSLRAG